MKLRTTAAVLSLVACCLPTFAQDKPQPPAQPSPEEMQAMMQAMSPGENHKHLARYVGDWTFTNKMWMDPSQPPTESTGTMHGESLMGGRYVRTHWKGSMMGMPFEGIGTDGYDNMAKKYVSAWIDNMGTGILVSTGTCEDNGNKCNTSGDMLDPMSGQNMTLRQVTTWSGNDAFVFEMFGNDPSGKEMKMMEMSLKRKK